MYTRLSRKRARAEAEDEATTVQAVSSSESTSSSASNSSRPATVHRAEDQGPLPKEKDKEFWFEDGTVILAARDVEFRVYGGLLADHSPVLKELLTKHKHPTRLVFFYGQSKAMCPVIRLEDSPEDLRHMLRMCMPRQDTRCVATPSLCGRGIHLK